MALLPVQDAFDLLWRMVPGPEAEEISFEEAAGRTLMGAVQAGRDDPPFDRSSMDGYALASAGTVAGSAYRVTAALFAGDAPRESLAPGCAAKIMTGAPVPPGADAVVPWEDCDAEGDRVVLRDAVRPGANVRLRGENIRAGEGLFAAMRRLDALDVAVGLSAGVTRARVSRIPSAAFVSTGSELAAPGDEPGPASVVDSNGPMLRALWTGWGGLARSSSSAGDEPEALRAAVEAGLGADVLVLTGGVSAGERDLVPEILRGAGVEVLFHKVSMKPGKPVLLGLRGRTVVLGLPGNPVSAFVGAVLFLRSVLRKRTGLPSPGWTERVLAAPAEGGEKRTRFEPAVLAPGGAVRLLPHRGSADIAAWREAELLAELPSGPERFPAGCIVRTLMFRHPRRDP